MSERTGFFWTPNLVCGCGWLPREVPVTPTKWKVTCVNASCSNFKVEWVVELEQAYGYRTPIIPS